MVAVESDVLWFPALKAPRAETKIVQIAVDPLYARYPIRGFPADSALSGTVSLNLTALADAVRQRADKSAVAERTQRWHAEHRRLREAWAATGIVASAAAFTQPRRAISWSGNMSMQSTGHGGTHSSQPVQASINTVCMRLGAPTIASIGQAWIHSVQPIHRSSRMSAAARGCSIPQAGSSGLHATPSTAARLRIPASPPGGQRLMSAAPHAIASAYGRQPA